MKHFLHVPDEMIADKQTLPPKARGETKRSELPSLCFCINKKFNPDYFNKGLLFKCNNYLSRHKRKTNINMKDTFTV